MAKPIGGDFQYNDMQIPPFMPGKKNMSQEDWDKKVGGDRSFREEEGWKPSDVSGQRFKKRYKI